MVYKKFLEKNGKKYGPYLYENKRVGQKIVTSYVGRSKPQNNVERLAEIYRGNKWVIFWTLLLVFVGLLLVLDLFLQFSPTSWVILNLQPTYHEGDPIKGFLDLAFNGGELIPKDAQIYVTLGDQNKIFYLSDLVSANSVSGNFYAKDTSISGFGDGYGLIGKKISYPAVDFKVFVYSDNLDSSNSSSDIPEVIVGSGSDSSGSSNTVDAPVVPSTPEPDASGEIPPPAFPDITTNLPADVSVSSDPSTTDSSTIDSSATDSASSDSSSQSSSSGFGEVTAQVISETEYTLDVRIDKEHPFTYNLEEGQNFRIVENSIKSDNGSDLNIPLRTIKEGNQLKISTDYSITESGFGEDFLTEDQVALPIDLAKLELAAENATLDVKLVYQDNLITSTKKNIVAIPNKDNNLTSNENLVNSSLILIKDISMIRIKSGNSFIINLSEYFENADSYGFNLDNFTGNINGELLTITPLNGFKGSKKAKIIAYSDNQVLGSNEFNILVSSGAVDISTIRSDIRVGQEVKWITNVSLETIENVSLQLPLTAENISVIKQSPTGQQEEISPEIKKITPAGEEILQLASDNSASNGVSLTGNVVMDVKLKKRDSFIFSFIKNLVKLTGFAVDATIIDLNSSDSGSIQVTIPQTENSKNYLLEYTTPAPTATEKETSYGKQVIVSAPSELNYQNVLSFTNISEIYSVGEENLLSVYWVENDSYLPFDAYDLDGNGKLDYIEWITPHLSDQTFDIKYGVMSNPCNGSVADSDCWSVQVNDLIWSNESIHTYAESTTDGINNTIILAGLSGSYPAADYCFNLLEGGYSDWYLPATDQLWEGRQALGLGGFPSESYWSSTERPVTQWDLAWKLWSTINTRIATYKNLSFSVRCLRDGIGDPTKLTTCGTISSSGSYILMNNVSMNGTCFTIAADNITVNLNGNTLLGNGSGNGIYSQLHNNITIFNGTLAGFDIGLYLSITTNSIFDNLSLINNNYGIYAFPNSDGNTFRNINSTFNSLDGLYLRNSANNNFYNFVSESNVGDGSYLYAATNSNFYGAYFFNNSNGLSMYSSSNGNSFYNTRSLSNNNGFYLDSVSSNQFYNSSSISNVNYGFYIFPSANNNNFYNSIVTQNSYGVYLFSSTGNLWNNLYVYNNTNQEILSTAWITAGGTILTYNNTLGALKFAALTADVDGDLILGNLENIRLANNLAFVNSTAISGLNLATNVTLKALSTNMLFPRIMKDGAICADCVNYTSLNAGNVTFRVTGWSSYSIQDIYYNTCPGNMAGFGNSSDPCIVTNCSQLQNISSNLSLSYKLGNDIDCSDTINWNYNATSGSNMGFMPIGQASPFNGVLEGNNKIVSNLFINRTLSMVGLFGNLSNSNISNLILSNVQIYSSSPDILVNSYAGSLAGNSINSNFVNIWASGFVNATNASYLGGLIGMLNGGNNVIDCSFNGSVFERADLYSFTSTGGLIGTSTSSNIKNSYSLGNVDSNQENVGGLVGGVYGNSIVNSSFSSSNVRGVDSLGGLVGYLGEIGNPSIIIDSYATGNVNIDNSGVDSFGDGGLVGFLEGNVINSFSTGNVNGYYAGGIAGVANGGSIINSFSTSPVSGSYDSGGLISGCFYGMSTAYIYNSSFDGVGSGQSSCTGGGFCQGDSVTSCTIIDSSMGGSNYFKGDVYPAKIPMSLWPFYSIWQERASNYPSLTWQNLGGNYTRINITTSIMINQSGVSGGSVMQGDNLTINVTLAGNISSAWVTIWQGLIGGPILLIQQMINYLSNFWSVTFGTNSTFPLGQVNYTIYANDTSGVNVSQNGSFYSYKGVYLSSCLDLNESNTLYSLMNNVSTTSTCFNITADNVTLNLNGFNVTGDNNGYDFGVYANGRKNIIVQNGLIQWFGRDVGQGNGVFFFNTDNSIVRDIKSINNFYGIYLLGGSDNNQIYDFNASRNNEDGIILDGSFNNTFYNSISSANSWYGLTFAWGAANNTFYNFSTSNNNHKGVAFYNSTNNYFNNLESYSNVEQEVYSENWIYAGGNILQYNNSFGQIKFVPLSSDINSDIQFGSGKQIQITNNLAYVNSLAVPELNISANISLYNVLSNFTNPIVFKDGQICRDCYLFTRIPYGNFVFNVSFWSNYSIGELPWSCSLLGMSGNGTLADPCVVNSCINLQNISLNLTASYKLIKNIDCSDTRNWNNAKGFEPIVGFLSFSGNLNGQNYSIYNLFINRTGVNNLSNVGLFANISNARISNLNLRTVNIFGQGANIGGIFGSGSGNISYCSVTGNITSLGYAGNMGGIGGAFYGPAISNSYAIVNVTGFYTGQNGLNGGALLGYSNGNISYCYSGGNVSGKGGNFGGLIGTLSGTVNNCYSRAGVHAYDVCPGYASTAGGLIGSGDVSPLINSYSTGYIPAESKCYSDFNRYQGFIGFYWSNTYTCYFDSQTAGRPADSGNGYPKTTVEMKNQSTFVNWSFSNVWAIDSTNVTNNGYPYLRWQNLQTNSAPVVFSVVLNTTDVRKNDTPQNLTVFISRVLDLEGDNITLVYNWYKNNILNVTSLITEGLVSYWPFNNDSKDYWGNNDSISSGAVPNVSGKVDGSYNFDGENDFIDLGNISINMTSFSFSAWVYMQNYSKEYGYEVFGWDNYSDCGIDFGVRGQNINVGRFGVWAEDPSSYAIDLMGDNVSLNTWNHMVLTFDYGTSTIKGYLNGFLNFSYNSYPGVRQCPGSLYLGHTAVNTGYLNGSLDEVMLFNRSLSASDVKMLYEGSKFGGNKLGSNNLLAGDNWKTGIIAMDYLSSGSETFSNDVVINSSLNITQAVVINQGGSSGGSFVRGENVTINATITGGVLNAWITIWQNVIGGPILLIQQMLNYFGNLWSATFGTNMSFSPGQINYTINATDIYGDNLSINGNFTLLENVNLTTCRVLDQANTVYTLRNNITVSGTCFNITAENVTLDGNGYTIIGNQSGNGILISGYSNAIIRNFRITNFSMGILLEYTGNVVVENNIVDQSSDRGIHMHHSSNNLVRNNIVSHSYYANINAGWGGSGILIINNTVSSAYGYPGAGIQVSVEVSNISVINNTIYNHTSEGGIYIFGTSNDLVDGNNISLSSPGINVAFSEGNISVRNNNIYGADYGVFLRYANYSFYYNNIINFCNYGIKIEQNSTGNTFLNNNITNPVVSSMDTYTPTQDATYKNLLIYNNSFGEIKWAKSNFTVNSSLFMPGTIIINNNSAYLNSNAVTGLNFTANVTLRSLSTTMIRPRIMKDNSICTTCYNFTSLNAGNVTFNVSSWSNYSIQDIPLFAGGNGNATNPYQIVTWTHLNNTRLNLTANYILINNLDASASDYAGLGDNWQPIGDCGGDTCIFDNPEHPFNGTFNGQGYTISNITINQPGIYGVGLFSIAGGNISNLNVQIDNITGANDVAGLVGYFKGLMVNSTSKISGLLSAGSSVGGLVGILYFPGNVTNSYSTILGNISAGDLVGGFVGYNVNGVIFNSSSLVFGTISGSQMIGGFVGDNENSIINCSSNVYGNITGSFRYVGGFAGQNVGTTIKNSLAIIQNSSQIFSTGPGVGGFLGYNDGAVTNCSSIVAGNITGVNYVGSIVGYNYKNYGSGSVSGSQSIAENFAAIAVGGFGVGLTGYNDVGTTVSSSYLTIRNPPYGNITFLDLITSGTAGNMISSISIGNNSVYVNSSKAYLNKRANITLSGLRTNLLNPKIVRDGVSICNSTTTPSCYNFTSLNAGTVKFNVSAWSNYSIQDVDQTAPNLTILGPQNATITNQTSINFTANVSDNVGLANATLNIYNQTGLYNQTVVFLGGATQATIGVVVTLVDGIYRWFWTVIDLAGNLFTTQNQAGVGNYTIIRDTTAPVVTILFPTVTAYNYHNQTLNFSVSDVASGLSSCWKRLNNGNNVTISCFANSTVNSSIGTIEGDNTLYLWANDSAGNVGSASVYFTIGTGAPAISLNTPVDNSYKNSSSINFTIHAIDSHGISTCALYGNWSGSFVKNYTWTSVVNDTDNSVIVNGISDGIYSWNVRCNDSLNNFAWHDNNHTFTVDTVKPKVAIVYPVNGTVYGQKVSDLNYSVSDLYISSCGYSTDNGVTNVSTNCSQNLSGLNGTDGWNNWLVYVNDSAGNLNVSRLSFYSTYLTNCGILSQPGNYILMNNVSTNGTCFTITADNVSLDLNGSQINGTNSIISFGIYNSGYNQTRVFNGIISGFNKAGGVNPDSAGIFLVNNSNSTIYNVSFNKNYIGVSIFENSLYNNVTSNILSNNSIGILIYKKSKFNNLQNNLVYSNSMLGIYLESSINNNIFYNTIINGSQYGLALFNASNNNIYSNVLTNNYYSLNLQSSSNYNLISNNNLSGSSSIFSINLQLQTNSKNNTFVNNRILNAYNEIYDLSGAGYNLVIYNSSTGEIKWNLADLDTNNDLTFPGNISISDNSVYYRPSGSSSADKLNSSANVTLYGIGNRGYARPAIFKDSAICLDCYNFTSLTAATVVFNVTGWSTYSIGEGATNVTQTITINQGGSSGGSVVREENVTINATITGPVSSAWVTVWQNVIGGPILLIQQMINYLSNFWSVTFGTNVTFPLGQVNYTIYANNSLNEISNLSGNFTVLENVNVTACRNLDQANTVYTLRNNLSTTQNCFSVNADNITIDGNGNSLSGDLLGVDYGIYINGKNNVYVKNINNITNFYYGIYFNNSLNSQIMNNSVYGSSGSDIYLGYTNSTYVANNTIGFTQYQSGIELVFSNNNFILNNNLTNNNGNAISLDTSSNNVLNNNTLISSFNNGLVIYQSSNNNFISNNYFDSNPTGIQLVANSVNNRIFNNLIKNSVSSIVSSDLSLNYVIYNNTLGQIFWGSNNITTIGNLILDSTINLTNSNAKISPSLLNANLFMNATANITFYNATYISDYPLILRKIIKSGTECGSSCYNFTSMNSNALTFNITDFGNGNISVGKFVRSRSEVALSTGWNMISLQTEHNQTGDANISLSVGWNLIGYSSDVNISMNNVSFTNLSGSNDTFTNSARAGKLQKNVAYVTGSGNAQKYSFVGKSGADTALTKNKGYWVYANQSGNITLPGVGGSLKSETYKWSDLMFSNGTDEKTSLNAVLALWISNTAYYWDSNTGYVPVSISSSQIFNPWDGYFIKTNRDNITVLRQN